MNEKYPLALPEGSVLAGQYIIEKVLGQGGFGITYEAKDHKTGERVAVKEFFPDAMATRTNQTTVSAFSGERGESFAYGKTCFLQEAETLAKFIGNENIVRIHSYFEENETAYFVMDFIEGTSFDEYLKDRGGKIPFEEAAQILVPVMDALSAVHSQGIVHRDVTPDNIYITKEGVVKLLDFGAARYSLGDKSRSLDIILKHGFAPKEQYTRRGKQGPYTDVYALGATFYFALTGKRPPDSVERLDEDDLVPPSSLGVQISGAAEDAILQALSVQPGDRFQSMMAFKNALYNSAAVGQPPLAAVGSQPVSQIYFNAPDQTSIPRSGSISRSGSMGSPAPGAGQDSDLQDLASTMKTAGLLAGKLAGKMAGKVAEKTAETAGVVAGTAGKMSEIMAAKKAETAEKLAAKMAEREAEKAAREAERAAQQAAEQAAAEAARQAAAEAAAAAPENTVGRTVGTVPGSTAGYTGGMSPDVPPSSTPPTKPPFNKKLLLIPAGVVAALLIGILVFKPGGDDKPGAGVTPTERPSASVTHTDPPSTQAPVIEPTDEPEPAATPEPAKTLAGSFTPVGNLAGNIMCGGYITAASGDPTYWIDNSGHAVYSARKNEYVYDNEESFFYDLSDDGGMLYFRYGNEAYVYDPSTGGTEFAPYLADFGSNVVRLFLTKDYYVVGYLNSDYTVTVYLVSRSNGQTFNCCTALGANMFTISDDGMLYYIGREDDIDNDCMGIYRVNMATLERERQLMHATDPDLRFQCPVVAGSYLYVICYEDSDHADYSIIRMDRTTGYVKDKYPICIWDVSSEVNQEFQTRVYLMLNVNAKTHEMYFSIGSPSKSYSYGLYKITGYEDNSFDLTLLSSYSYSPNIIYYTDGGYEVNYMHYDEDEDVNKLYYSRYDANGNNITNN